MIGTLRKLAGLFDARTKRNLAILLLVMLLTAILEAVSIALIVPLLQVLLAPDSIPDHPYLGDLYRLAGSTSPGEFATVAIIALAAGFLLKNGFLLLLSYLRSRLLAENIASLMSQFFTGYLYCPTTFHLQTNSASIIRNIWSSCQSVLSSGIQPFLQLLTEGLVVLAIGILLAMVAPLPTMAALLIFGVTGGLYYAFTKRHMHNWGRLKQAREGDAFRWINQGLGALNEIKLSGREDFVSRRLSTMISEWARYRRLQDFFSDTPRPVIEVIAVIALLAAAFYFAHNETPPAQIVTILALFGMAAMRLMPSASRIAISLNNMRFALAAIDLLYDDKQMFDAEARRLATTRQAPPIRFEKVLEIRDLDFRYPNTATKSLTAVSLSIERGQAIALVGPSGAGKSTLAMVIMGLLPAEAGGILIDGKKIDTSSAGWKSKIGYIPQDIYLLDDTLRRNIAFGVDDTDIDEDRLGNVITMARLDNVISGLPEGLDTLVGERGVRLSGGQRQRVAIARALYGDPEILVMDEATSSLDTETESELVAAINQLHGHKTLIVVAHRMSTVRNCDRLFFLQNGRITDSGIFDELVARNADFRRIALGETDLPLMSLAESGH